MNNRTNTDDLPDDVPRVAVEDLTDEQRDRLEQVRAEQEFREATETLQEFDRLVQQEVRRQNEWIETQIWETDWTEVHTLDIVTLQPVASGALPPDIHAHRYAHAESVPRPSEYHRRGYSCSVQRVDRETYMELVNAEQVEVPDDVSILHGPRGVDDADELPGDEEGEDA